MTLPTQVRRKGLGAPLQPRPKSPCPIHNVSTCENALTVATVLGGYGIPCWFFVQSLRSIDGVYTREGRQTLVNSARAQIFLGAQDPEDQHLA